MNDKAKNIITNLLGIKLVFAGSFFYFTEGIELSEYGVLMAAGLALFLFKAEQTKNFISRILHKKTGMDEKK